MKIRPFAFTVLSGLVIALGLAVLVSQSASAQCFNPLGLPVTCPGSNTGDKKKKPVPTPVTALGAPRPTPTQPSQASPGSTAACVPSQDQLASLCAALPGAGGSNGGSNPTNPGGDTPTAPKPQMFSFFQLELGGAGGVLLGILDRPALARGWRLAAAGSQRAALARGQGGN